MIVESIQNILQSICTPEAVRAVERGESDAALWDAIESAGFLELLAPETRGGAGISMSETYPVLALLGAHAVPAPVAQSIMARLLVSEQQLPAGRITLAAALREQDGRWICPRVPFGVTAEHVITARDDGQVVLVDTAAAQRLGTGVYGSLLADLVWSDRPAETPLGCLADELHRVGAAMHAALLAGAIGRVFALTLQYANDRVQFGKSIGKFQAVQQQMSVMAENVAAATVAAQLAFQEGSAIPDFEAAAMAKSRCSEAAGLIAAIAHAVHGAMGMTQEYELQLLTRRLHEWRIIDGSEHHWNIQLGRRLLADPTLSVANFSMSVTARNAT